jgi:hypothetical protein
MKRFEELLVGVLLFFIVDRASRLVSSIMSSQRNMSDMETETFRTAVEAFTMITVFLVLWFGLHKGTGRS